VKEEPKVVTKDENTAEVWGEQIEKQTNKQNPKRDAERKKKE